MYLVTCTLVTGLLYVFASPIESHTGRIIGGEDIPIEKVPFQISLQYDGKHSCGGSIISPNYVVTAAHCLDDYPTESLSVRAGTSTREEGGQVVSVREKFVHPEFDGLDYDIGVVELADSLEFSDKIAAITLPSPNQTWPGGTEVMVSGWGVLHLLDTTLPVNLQGVTVDLYDEETCMNDFFATEQMLCAGVDGGGKDACYYDSGGPLQVDGTLVGIVSFGNGCAAANYPGMYANVAALRDFVTNVTGI